ncbi:cell division protein SepF [Candidatus Woesearchaeota archaeon]|nr:cell division protein SepF [Candidatus Woesearchaeota archaeon]
MGIFSKIKERFQGEDELSGEEHGEQYLELDSGSQQDREKVTVRSFLIEDFNDVKDILDSLREGKTIALVNVKPLKDKDLIELKRAVNKLKKTTDAIEGDIAGFGDDWIAITPAFAHIYRNKRTEPVQEE